jgi:hypothetical protein
MRTLEDVQTWRGMTMVDADGDKIGSIDDIYLDRQSGEPEWATVRTGLFGMKSSFVPIREAEVTPDNQVRVPFQKEQVKDAPNIDPDGELSEEEERRLYEHYGRSDYGEWQGQDRTTALGLPDDRAGRIERPGEGAAPTQGAPGEAPGEAPAVVGVRLRRVVVVAGEPERRGAPGMGPDQPAAP